MKWTTLEFVGLGTDKVSDETKPVAQKIALGNDKCGTTKLITGASNNHWNLRSTCRKACDE